MAQIIINEISENYAYNIGNNSFATVALPITAAWGPAFTSEPEGTPSSSDQLDSLAWNRFPGTQQGLEAFVSTYRGPESIYKLSKDYSYQTAMTLLTSGYDILVCRISCGTNAQGEFIVSHEEVDEGDTTTVVDARFVIKAKYVGTFGNTLKAALRLQNNSWNLVVYVVNSSGTQTAVENLRFTFGSSVSDNIPNIKEVESNFFDFEVDGDISDNTVFDSLDPVVLSGGSDIFEDDPTTPVADLIDNAAAISDYRYVDAGYEEADSKYYQAIRTLESIVTDRLFANILLHNEIIYSYAYFAYNVLKDKLAYNPQRIISPGWDDQDFKALGVEYDPEDIELSPLHIKLMDVAYNSRCATSLLDIPKSVARGEVKAYAQELSEHPSTLISGPYQGIDILSYATHSALFAPWGQYQYVGTSKQNIASPAFLALMIQRAMILNQSIQYEWALPTTRKHTLKFGKLDYTVSKSYLDSWQASDGVGINAITHIPDLGISLWGNSTLYDVPPAMYQALASLSTRYLVNAIENVAYRCGISITFQYNNEQAYNKFYAGITPILDTMKNVGAIDDYYIRIAADINVLDQVNANSVIAKVYLVINGVINDITVDLIALPPGTDLNRYKA